jgi:hypothetical protein
VRNARGAQLGQVWREETADGAVSWFAVDRAGRRSAHVATEAEARRFLEGRDVRV